MSSKSNQWSDQVGADANREAERKRQARLDKGLERIKTAFEGKRVLDMSTPVKMDWKKFKAPRDAYLKPGAMYKTPGNDAEGIPYGYSYDAASGGLKDSSGKVFKPGTKFTYYNPKGNERSDPFQVMDDEYKAAILKLQQPELAKQYGKALGDTFSGLWDAGTFESSAKKRLTDELIEQNTFQGGQIVDNASKAVADQVASRAAVENNAIQQLNSAEDPDIAVSAALASKNTLAENKPVATPLGQVFQAAMVGGAGAIQGYRGQQSINDIRRRVGETRIT